MQFCPAARALDVIGERWSLLVIRELLLGPKRYSDLQSRLPGIGPNVLSTRLRALERAHVVRKRRLPPPAASTVYELTELGLELQPVLEDLFSWGRRLIDGPSDGETVKASYWIPAIRAAASANSLPRGLAEEYELRIGDEVVSVAVRDGRVDVRDGECASAAVVVRMDTRTFIELGRGSTSAVDALKLGRLTLEGDEDAAARCAALFGQIAAVRA
jgi:DNA-binding HxlR family transcriptional regulator/putative sterol carrier protein